MDILTIVQWTSYAIAGILLLTLPLRLRSLSKKIGQCHLPLTRRKNPLYIAIMIFAIVMLVVLKYRDFSMLVVFTLHGTAVLGIEMASREIIYGRITGIYENFLIVDGRFIKRENIILFPTLEFETTPSRALEILTHKSGTITVHFENEIDRATAVTMLRQWINHD